MAREKESKEKETKKTCRACGSERNMKYGFRHGKQRYLCKECGFQFTIETERHSEIDERRAITLYCLGFSFRVIGRLLNYHYTTILRWVKEYAKRNYEKPKPKGEVMIELDEMHRYIRSKKTFAGYGKHMTALMEGYLIGKWETEIPQLLKKCITD